ncbi:hypothetical protein GCM10009678_11520 [Actinomadura kijaniata]|uniref:Anti-anti-sigma regulatory factor n=1 Tax=Actinomadura namibiensis TaxID=182080 RepID=A0A7W3LNC4_ACTNM|nr:MEDS domain-containing protein [Actinomadura namibiensis]MBA8951279.1 anti-anti-sigma regulatory factor [Actinomadura namibiensis]
MEPTWFDKRPVGEVRPGDHAWLAYGTPEERDRVIGAFVADALRTEEKVVYVTDAPPERLPGLTGPRTRLDLCTYTASGQLRVIPRSRACLDDGGRFDPQRMLETLNTEVERAFDEGFRAVRLTTDHSWLMREPGRSDLHRVLGCEHQVGDAVSPSTMAMAICQVDRRLCPPDQLAALRDTHEVLVEVNPEFDDGILRITRTFEPHGLRIEGELDAARHSVFAQQLSLVAHGRRRVHLDFSRLGFIDLGTLNLLAEHATGLDERDALVLDNLPPDVENVIEMVGWHRLPGLARGRSGAADGPIPGPEGVA